MAHVLETKLKLDTSDFVRKSKAAQKEVKKVDAAGTRAGKSTTKELGKASQAMGTLGASAGTAATTVVTKFATAAAAIAGITKIIGASVEQMKRIGQEQAGFLPRMQAAIVGRGDTANAREVTRMITSTLPQLGIHQDKALGLYEGVGGALPTEDWKTVRAVMGQGADAMKAGFDPEKYGMLLGEMRKTFPKMGIMEIGERSAAIAQTAGSAFSKIGRKGLTSMRQLMDTGAASPEEAQRLMMASLYETRSTEGIDLLGDQLATQKGNHEIAGMSSAGLRKYYRAAPADRLKMLRSNPDMARQIFGTQAGSVLATLKRAPSFKGKTRGDMSAMLDEMRQQNPKLAAQQDIDEANARATYQEQKSEDADLEQRIEYDRALKREAGAAPFLNDVDTWAARWISAPAYKLGLTDKPGADLPPVIINNNVAQQYNATPGRIANTATTRPAGGGQ